MWSALMYRNNQRTDCVKSLKSDQSDEYKPIYYDFIRQSNEKAGIGNRPIQTVLIISLLIDIGFMIFGHVGITFGRDAQAGLGMIFVPIWSNGIGGLSFLIGWFIISRKRSQRINS